MKYKLTTQENKMKVKTVRMSRDDGGESAPLNAKQFKKWMIALRSGEYTQAKNVLQTKDGYCCLGVACDLFIPKEQQLRRDNQSGPDLLIGSLPKEQANAPAWLKILNRDFDRRLGKAGHEGYYVSSMNDSLGMSFDEIADVLELVYVHGMMEEK